MMRFCTTIHLFFFLLLFGGSLSAVAQQRWTVSGTVIDSKTGEPVSFASVYVDGTPDGGTVDEYGKFSFKTTSRSGKLIVSFIGYSDYSEEVDFISGKHFKISLQPETITIQEAVIKPPKYSKKNNPAVEFIKNVMEHRFDHALDERYFYRRDRYENIVMSVNNFDEKKQNNFLFRSFKFMNECRDTSPLTGKPILPLSTREFLATDYYWKAGSVKKQYVKARTKTGLGERSPQGVDALYLEMLPADIDPYANSIYLLTMKFVSPLSRSVGTDFYRYYLNDTLEIDGVRCIDVMFTPQKDDSYGFNGHLYVQDDSTFFIKRIECSLPKFVNLNFSDYLSFSQDFDRTSDSTRILVRENIIADCKLIKSDDGICLNKKVEYSNYSFVPEDDAAKLQKKKDPVIEDMQADNRSAEYWAEHRPSGVLPETEMNTTTMIEKMREIKWFRWFENIYLVLYDGYIPTAKKNSKFMIGPLHAIFSYNAFQNFRMRLGGKTTTYLMPKFPHLFFDGHVIYGSKDNWWGGDFEMEYSFRPKKMYAVEYPIHSIKVRYETDIKQFGQDYKYINKDNTLLSIKRRPDNLVGYFRKAGLTYTLEELSGFSVTASAYRYTDYSSSFLPFLVMNGGKVTNSIDRYSLSCAQIELGYAPHQNFVQTGYERIRINTKYPIFTLSHTVAVKDVLKSDFTYNKTEFSYFQRIWLSAFGAINTIVKAGKVWNKAPFTMLCSPNANMSYIHFPESFALLNPMEFITDQYITWDATYFLYGWFFHLIPGLKRLPIREVLSCRGYWGSLSDKNNPMMTDGLLRFPTGTGTMGNVPYVELAVGIDNILKIFRVDYVWRVTYRNQPDCPNWGIRVGAHISF